MFIRLRYDLFYHSHLFKYHNHGTRPPRPNWSPATTLSSFYEFLWACANGIKPPHSHVIAMPISSSNFGLHLRRRAYPYSTSLPYVLMLITEGLNVPAAICGDHFKFSIWLQWAYLLCLKIMGIGYNCWQMSIGFNSWNMSIGYNSWKISIGYNNIDI